MAGRLKVEGLKVEGLKVEGFNGSEKKFVLLQVLLAFLQ